MKSKKSDEFFKQFVKDRNEAFKDRNEAFIDFVLTGSFKKFYAMKMTIKANDFCPDDCEYCLLKERLEKDDDGRFKTVRTCDRVDLCKYAVESYKELQRIQSGVCCDISK